ncbi:hypothetical protein EYF80_034756 [Liparis tanakae]|uniref:Uncharacterized protein n=1 Tax=Liparis tanakae TaxID=230148 RepID=A0A4Z2GPA0_9TELE|nr:hypothetical protein EYF80_034756 [Liparis tanakae]
MRRDAGNGLPPPSSAKELPGHVTATVNARRRTTRTALQRRRRSPERNVVVPKTIFVCGTLRGRRQALFRPPTLLHNRRPLEGCGGSGSRYQHGLRRCQHLPQGTATGLRGLGEAMPAG